MVNRINLQVNLQVNGNMKRRSGGEQLECGRTRWDLAGETMEKSERDLARGSRYDAPRDLYAPRSIDAGRSDSFMHCCSAVVGQSLVSHYSPLHVLIAF